MLRFVFICWTGRYGRNKSMFDTSLLQPERGIVLRSSHFVLGLRDMTSSRSMLLLFVAAWMPRDSGLSIPLSATIFSIAKQPERGIEPPTRGLQNRCSTPELLRRVNVYCNRPKIVFSSQLTVGGLNFLAFVGVRKSGLSSFEAKSRRPDGG